MEELRDILVGLEQRINAYKSRFQDLEKKRRRLDDEIATIKKYLELAETLYRVEPSSPVSPIKSFPQTTPGAFGLHRSWT